MLSEIVKWLPQTVSLSDPSVQDDGVCSKFALVRCCTTEKPTWKSSRLFIKNRFSMSEVFKLKKTEGEGNSPVRVHLCRVMLIGRDVTNIVWLLPSYVQSLLGGLL